MNKEQILELIKEGINKGVEQLIRESNEKQENILKSFEELKKQEESNNITETNIKVIQKKIKNSTKTALVEEIQQLKEEKTEICDELRRLINENRQLKRKDVPIERGNKGCAGENEIKAELEFYKKTCLLLIDSAKNRMDAAPIKSEIELVKRNSLKKPSELLKHGFLCDTNPNTNLLKVLPNNESINVDSCFRFLPINCFTIDLSK